ncbi:PepSY domain-containing protein [Streptomyces sp. NPDC055239]
MRIDAPRRNSGAPRARQLRLVGAVCALVASAALVTGCGEDSGDKAAATAVDEVKGSKLTDLELKSADDVKDDDGDDDAASASPSPSASAGAAGPQWVAEVAEKDGTSHTVRIDAVSGKVLKSEPERDRDADDKKETADWLSRVKQSPEQAAETAVDKTKGTVTSVGLDDKDDGSLVWSVDVVTKDWNKTDFEIDAVKGDITHEHVDRD